MNSKPRTQEKARKILIGWKEIANYLGMGVRTVQRHERQLGLPVRRPAGKLAGSVLATRAELDGWVAATPLREVFRLSPPPMDKTSIDTRAALSELNRQVAEMRQLRQASTELRKALHESVELLRQNLRFNLTEETSLESRIRADESNLRSTKIQ